MNKGKQFLEDDDGQLHFNFPGTKANLDRERRRRSFDLQPHEMSPQEFIDHPDTLFHGTYEPKIEGLQKKVNVFEDWADAIDDEDATREEFLDNLDYDALSRDAQTHVGSEVAAIMSPRHEMVTNVPRYIHAVHVPFKTTYGTFDDSDANSGNVNISENGDVSTDPVYYYNEYEDSSHLSAAIPKTNPLTHADYVKQALAQGKGDEIHPETLRRYQNGTLTSVARELSPKEVNQSPHVPEYQTALDHYGGLFPKILLPKGSDSEYREHPRVGTEEDAANWEGDVWDAEDYYKNRMDFSTGSHWGPDPATDAERVHNLYGFGKPKRVYNQGEHPFGKPTMSMLSDDDDEKS